MNIKATIEIRIDEDDLKRWVDDCSLGVRAVYSRSDILSDIEGLEFPETVSGLKMMMHVYDAEEE